MQSTIKLTLRLPARLHEQLRLRARSANRSLNTVVVEAISNGLSKEVVYPETEQERVLRVLRESGLWEPLGPPWDKYTKNAPAMTHAELREKLKGVPPLSEVIIEEREPRG